MLTFDVILPCILRVVSRILCNLRLFLTDINKIGKWKVSILETGDFWLDGGAMMGSVPKVLWQKTNPCDDLNRIQLAMRCLLLDDGKNIVLIETGIGNKNSDKFIKMFNIKQNKNTLSNNLSKFNYSLENITHEVLTVTRENTEDIGVGGRGGRQDEGLM